jgi:ComF family protein
MDMFERLRELLFPRKCLFCRKILPAHQTFLCADCRENEPVFSKEKINFSFVARWTAVWYYKDNVRQSLLRYKFARYRSYVPCYGRLLAMKLQNTRFDNFDILTWVPVSRLRRMKRGFDQVELLAKETARQLGIEAVPCLKKIRHTPPQSGLKTAAQRRANVLGAYVVTDPEILRNKRVLLLDDIITTGATVSECARMLLLAGVKDVRCAAMAVASHEQKSK